MTSQLYHLKLDAFTAARGGTCGFLLVSCAACQHEVLLYQKDLPYGPLLRMYADRIHAPATPIDHLTQSYNTAEEMPALRCPTCDALIATPMVYEKENRLAYHVADQAIEHAPSDGVYPPAIDVK